MYSDDYIIFQEVFENSLCIIKKNKYYLINIPIILFINYYWNFVFYNYYFSFYFCEIKVSNLKNHVSLKLSNTFNIIFFIVFLSKFQMQYIIICIYTLCVSMRRDAVRRRMIMFPFNRNVIGKTLYVVIAYNLTSF